ncbi:MAG TPA: hypothetical protein VGS41_02540, partial [Chthonomonadales bacterium]|nr:hypothetical protein [Chthonomonadales bacterium]
SPSPAVLTAAGSTLQLAVAPENPAGYIVMVPPGNISYVVPNNAVATVNSSGLITATGPGTETVTITESDSGISVPVVIHVGPAVGRHTVVFSRDTIDLGTGFVTAADIYALDIDTGVKTQLTSGPGLNFNPAPNADGTRILFTSSRDGSHQTYVMFADGTGQQRLTKNSAQNESPRFSPDGSKIVFVSNMDHPNQPGIYDIYTMKPDGTGVTRLTNTSDSSPSGTVGNIDPAWSPDGSRIAFSSDRTVFNNQPVGNVWIMNADGSNPVQLTTATDPARVALEPWFSPDGTKLVYRADNPQGPKDIWIMSVNGTGQTQLTHDGLTNLKPVFTPDGNIVYSWQSTPPPTASNSIVTFPNGLKIMDQTGANVTTLTNNSISSQVLDQYPHLRLNNSP